MTDSKVSVIYTEQKGRCWTTNHDVSQGDILIVSKPYALIPSTTKKNYVCANCMYISKEQTRTTEMVACRQACLHVFYCSDKCERRHWDKFHQYECSFLDEVYALQAYNYNEYVINYARLVMRMLTQRLHDLLDNPQNVLLEDAFMMLSHFDEFPREKKNEFGTVAKTLTKYILMRLIPQLTKNNHEFISFMKSFLPDSADAKKVEIIYSDQWLTETARLCSLSDDAAIIEILKYLVHKVYILICMEEVNGFFHSTFKFDSYSQPPQMYALGVYPSAVFFNHSCSPNIDRFLIEEDGTKFQMGDLVFFATHPLMKNEELCISYGGRKCDLYMQDQVNVDDIIKDQIIRKQELKDVYFFDCACARCVSESKGELDQSFMALVKELKCTKPKCKGWFIPCFEKHSMCSEACRVSR